MKLDTSGMTALVRRLESVGGNVPRTVEKALSGALQRISRDTHEALLSTNLPAKGKFSKGATDESVIDAATVTWSGSVASIPIGFDFSKPGAGGFLITGTPKMKPDAKLHAMYKQKKYMAEIQNEMADVILSAIVEETT